MSKLKHIVAAARQSWHLDRGNLLAFATAIAAVVVAGVIGSGPFWLVGALVLMQVINAVRIVAYRARSITEADAFLDYLTSLGEYEELGQAVPDGETADL